MNNNQPTVQGSVDLSQSANSIPNSSQPPSPQTTGHPANAHIQSKPIHYLGTNNNPSTIGSPTVAGQLLGQVLAPTNCGPTC